MWMRRTTDKHQGFKFNYPSWCFSVTCNKVRCISCHLDVFQGNASCQNKQNNWARKWSFQATSSWDVSFSHFTVCSLAGRYVKIYFAYTNIISHCKKEVRYNMGELPVNFLLLKQYQVLHDKWWILTHKKLRDDICEAGKQSRLESTR